MKQRLAGRIRSGEYPAGQKLSSIRELAREYGVSYVTAHKVLSSLSHEGLLSCRNGVGIFVRPLDQKIRIRKLAVPLRLCGNPVFARFFEEILGQAARRGIPVAVGGDSRTETDFLRESAESGCDAVIRFPGAGMQEHEVYGQLRKSSLRTVVLNDWWQEGAGIFPCVRSDEAGAAEELLEHMYQLGHRRIALVQEIFHAQRCGLLKAFYRWHYRHGLKVEPEALDFTAAWKNKLELVRRLKRDGYTAALFSYDLLALKIMELAEAVDEDLLRDFCMAGMDDIPESENAGLTSFRHDVAGIADEAFRLLQSPDYDRREVRLIPGKCIFRESTLGRRAPAE